MEQVSASRYVELVNAQMREHREYRPGMAVQLDVVDGRPVGIKPVALMDGLDVVSAWAEFEITQKYEVDPPFADWRALGSAYSRRAD